MYEVSDKYISVITANQVDMSDGGWYGSLTTAKDVYDYGGEYYDFIPDCRYEFRQKDIVEGSSTLRYQIGSGSSMEIGGTGSTELTLGLKLEKGDSGYIFDGKTISSNSLYNARIILSFKIKIDAETDEYEDIPIGEFYVTEAKRTGSTLNLTAYDKMLFFEKEVRENPFYENDSPYRILSIACRMAGVRLGTEQNEIESMPNGTSTFTVSKKAGMTYREVVSGITEILCANATIDRLGNLIVVKYAGLPGVRSIPPSWRYSSDIAEFWVKYRSVYIPASDGVQEARVSYSSDIVGLEYEITDNVVISSITTKYDRVVVAEAVLEGLHNIQYVPFKASCPMDPSLDLIDCVVLDGSVYGPLMSIEMDIGGGMTIEAKGENPRFTKVKSKLSSTISSTVAEAASTPAEEGGFKLEMDDVPTEGSQNAVTSDGLYKVLGDISAVLDAINGETI